MHESIWLNTEQLMKYLGRSKNAIYQLVSKGILIKRKFAGRLYFKKQEIDDLIEKGGDPWQ